MSSVVEMLIKARFLRPCDFFNVHFQRYNFYSHIESVRVGIAIRFIIAELVNKTLYVDEFLHFVALRIVISC